MFLGEGVEEGGFGGLRGGQAGLEEGAAGDDAARGGVRPAQLGLPLPEGFEDTPAAKLVRPIIARQRELSRRLSDRLCAADGRIQAFLDEYLADTGRNP